MRIGDKLHYLIITDTKANTFNQATHSISKEYDCNRIVTITKLLCYIITIILHRKIIEYDNE